jgi:hypothetical protein
MKTNTQENFSAGEFTPDRVLRILHLEDTPGDRLLVQHHIAEQKLAAVFTHVDNEKEFVAVLEKESFDVILADKDLPGYDGLSALCHVRARHPHIPFIFVTGSMGEEAAIATMRNGATDYVLKGRLSRLVPALQRAVREAKQQANARLMEERNREQAALLDKAQDAVLVVDMEDRICFWNKSAEKTYGWPAAGVFGRKATVLLPTDPIKYQEARRRVMEEGSWTGEMPMASCQDKLIVESRWSLVRDEFGKPKSILIIDTDITEKKALEAKFLRSQRMDSIGALAGGIAHDLNNALAPVLMSADLMESCPSEEDRAKFLQIIRTSARRATGLVAQILGFARGSGGERGPLDLNQLLDEMSKMVRDTFPKSIFLSATMPRYKLWSVRGDATEMHQVLLNLCVNARDAMPKGGQLTLAAENFTLGGEKALAAHVKEGPYVVLSVADTGSGIPSSVLPHIYEPFFTTKSGDKGTGLGLSTVAEIVKRSGGFVEIQTQENRGTEFKIYFPAIASPQVVETPEKEGTLPTGRGELLLIIDDEETIRELLKTTLESYGYRVVTAQNGLEGIARFREYSKEIKLLVTDTDMPHLDGMGAVRAIKELKPDVPVIVASGSKRDAAVLREIDTMGLKDLGKPYSLEQLLVAVDLGLH